MMQIVSKARYPLILVLIAMIVLMSLGRFPWTSARALSTPTADDIAIAMRRCDLTPETLAAAGITANEVAGIIEDVGDELVTALAPLETADDDYATAKLESDRLRRLIQSGQGAEDDVAAYQTALASLQAAKSTRQTILEEIFEAAVDSLSSSEQDTLTSMCANATWKLPAEFLVTDHIEAQWVDLRECLDHERISADLGEDPDPQLIAALNQFRADPQVIAAKFALDANLVGVTSAWETALAGE